MFWAEHICAFTGTTQLPRNPGQYLPWLVLLFFPSSIHSLSQDDSTSQTDNSTCDQLYYLKASVSRWHHFLSLLWYRNLVSSLPSKDYSVDEHHVTLWSLEIPLSRIICSKQVSYVWVDVARLRSAHFRRKFWLLAKQSLSTGNSSTCLCCFLHNR